MEEILITSGGCKLFVTLMIFLKELFDKANFDKKKSADDKKGIRVSIVRLR